MNTEHDLAVGALLVEPGLAVVTRLGLSIVVGHNFAVEDVLVAPGLGVEAVLVELEPVVTVDVVYPIGNGVHCSQIKVISWIHLIDHGEKIVYTYLNCPCRFKWKLR